MPCHKPYGAFARGLTENIFAGMVLWQCGPEGSVLGHAARKGFKGLKDADLQPLLRELNLQSVGYLICKKVFFYFFRFKKKMSFPATGAAEQKSSRPWCKQFCLVSALTNWQRYCWQR